MSNLFMNNPYNYTGGPRNLPVGPSPYFNNGYQQPDPNFNTFLHNLSNQQQAQNLQANQQFQQGQTQAIQNPAPVSQLMQPSTSPAPPPSFQCFQTTELEAVKSVQVDFSGKPVFYFSPGENRIYIKQLDFDTGAAKYQVYNLAFDTTNPNIMPPSKEESSQTNDSSEGKTSSIAFPQNMLTKEDLDKFSNDLMAMVVGIDDRVSSVLNSLKDKEAS